MTLEQFVHDTIKQVQAGIDQARKEGTHVSGPEIVSFDCQVSPDGDVVPSVAWYGSEPSLHFTVMVDRQK